MPAFTNLLHALPVAAAGWRPVVAQATICPPQVASHAMLTRESALAVADSFRLGAPWGEYGIELLAG